MIRPINTACTSFCADINTRNPVTGEYKDPLMRWPLRGAAFTNEVGEALRPLIGNYATLSWIPALLYIGADIYDKYKNDSTEYSPDSRRCLKQAIFQGMASVCLPLVAVKTGQNILSFAGIRAKDKITINSKEHINKIAADFIANGKMHAYHNKDNECISDFLDIVNNNMDYKKQSESISNPLKKAYIKIEEYLTEKCNVNHRYNIENYAKTTISDLIQLRKDLLNPTDEFKQTNWYTSYNISLEKGQTKNVAVKSVLNKYIQNKGQKGRFIKTAGGFIALGLAIKPIDHFVEHVLIGKFVGPGIDKTKKAP